METLKVKNEDLEFIDIDGGGIPIYHYQGNPFTGIIVDYFFGTNVIAGETEYINGQTTPTTFHMFIDKDSFINYGT